MNPINKILRNLWIVRAIIPSIVFNLKNLPFSQAIKLPILLYKAKVLNSSGKITIISPVKFGMIRLGRYHVSLFPNNGIVFENRGHIIFKGKTVIGNNSAISVGETGNLEFGQNFTSYSGLKIACYHSIIFKNNILVGWNTQFIDTDFHLLKNINGKKMTKGFGPIKIGHNVWIANGCRIYKNVTIPNTCVVGADTILHSPVTCSPLSLITSDISVKIRATGIYHDSNDDTINYHITND